MLRSVLASSRVPGSIFFFSTILVLLIIENPWPTEFQESFQLLFLVTIISLILGTTEIVNWIFISAYTLFLLFSKIFDINTLFSSISGDFTKGLIDSMVSKIFIILGLLSTILLLNNKGIPNILIEPYSTSFDVATLSIIILIAISLVIISLLFIWESYKNYRIIVKIVIFEQYRRPLEFGYEWEDDGAVRRTYLRKPFTETFRLPKIRLLEGHLRSNDYTSFALVCQTQLIDHIEEIGSHFIRQMLGMKYSKDIKNRHVWMEQIVKIPEKIGDPINHGLYCISKIHKEIIFLSSELALIVNEINTYCTSKWAYFINENDAKESISLDPKSVYQFIDISEDEKTNINKLDINSGSSRGLKLKSDKINFKKIKNLSDNIFIIYLKFYKLLTESPYVFDDFDFTLNFKYGKCFISECDLHYKKGTFHSLSPFRIILFTLNNRINETLPIEINNNIWIIYKIIKSINLSEKDEKLIDDLQHINFNVEEKLFKENFDIPQFNPIPDYEKYLEFLNIHLSQISEKLRTLEKKSFYIDINPIELEKEIFFK